MYKPTVAIDIREAIAANPAGKGVYNLEMTKNLILDLNYEWLLLTDQPTNLIPTEQFPNAKIVVLPAKGLLWHFKAKKFLQKNGVDIYLAMTSFLTPYLLRKSQVKVYIFVHDLICFLYPDGHPWKAKLIENFCLPPIIDFVAGIFTVSNNTKSDLIQLFPHIHQQNIQITGCGYTPKNQVPLEPTKRLNSNQYLLSVSTLLPRKNFETLIQAFNQIKSVYSGDLIIIGGSPDNSYLEKLKTLIQEHNLQDRVKIIGFVSNQDLASYYQFADIFIYPSRYEGFGIPILEAMTHSCPVITSNTSSLPEVAENAALYFDPNSHSELSERILELYQNHELQNSLIAAGKLQTAKFSWSSAAKKVLTFIQRV
jgi:glycosyltransferase involved in cell wall biosynthesis